MDISKEYIVDDKGNINKVVLDYKDYLKIEELFLDYGFAKAIKEAESDIDYDLDTAKKIIELQEWK